MPLQDANPMPSFGGFGLTLEKGLGGADHGLDGCQLVVSVLSRWSRRYETGPGTICQTVFGSRRTQRGLRSRLSRFKLFELFESIRLRAARVPGQLSSGVH